MNIAYSSDRKCTNFGPGLMLKKENTFIVKFRVYMFYFKEEELVKLMTGGLLVVISGRYLTSSVCGEHGVHGHGGGNL